MWDPNHDRAATLPPHDCSLTHYRCDSVASRAVQTTSACAGFEAIYKVARAPTAGRNMSTFSNQIVVACPRR
jgi:hypothetical protein